MRENLLLTIQKVWDYPTRMNEAMWYLLLAFFGMIQGEWEEFIFFLFIIHLVMI